MNTHAILITYRDLETQNTELVKKASNKYKERFKQLYFDSGWVLHVLLSMEVVKIPTEDKLKIYISGHGGTGQQYITDNAGVRKQTVEDLAMLLALALEDRATSMGASANTEVNMVACLFGRISSSLKECPAVRLHKALAAKEVYVDLVARTEKVVAKPSGRLTISLRQSEIDALKSTPLVAFRKTQFTKIRCTYQTGAAVVLIRDYKGGDDIHINSDSTEGRCILWADYVINELVKYITPSGGQTQVTDVRHLMLYATVDEYDKERNPYELYEWLTDLLDPKEKWNVATQTQTVKLIKRLRGAYPGIRSSI
jgi:hypothetical protein